MNTSKNILEVNPKRIHADIYLNFEGNVQDVENNLSERLKEACSSCHCFSETHKEQALIKAWDLSYRYRTFHHISLWLRNLNVINPKDVPLEISCPTSSEDAYEKWNSKHIKRLTNIKNDFIEIFKSLSKGQQILASKEKENLIQGIQKNITISNELLDVDSLIEELFSAMKSKEKAPEEVLEEFDTDSLLEELFTTNKEQVSEEAHEEVEENEVELLHKVPNKDATTPCLSDEELRFITLYNRCLYLIHKNSVHRYDLDTKAFSPIKLDIEKSIQSFPFHCMTKHGDLIGIGIANDVHVYRAPNLERLYYTAGTVSDVLCLSIFDDQNQKRMLTGTNSGSIETFQLGDSEKIEKLNLAHHQAHQKPIHSLKVNPKVGLIFTGGSDRILKIWNLRTREMKFQFSHIQGIADIELNPYHSKLIAASDSKGDVIVLDTRKKQRTKKNVLNLIPIMQIPNPFADKKNSRVKLFWKDKKTLLIGQKNLLSTWDITKKQNINGRHIDPENGRLIDMTTHENRLYCATTNGVRSFRYQNSPPIESDKGESSSSASTRMNIGDLLN